MRSAPSVVYPVGRCFFFAVSLVLVGCLALALLVVWWWPLLGLSTQPYRAEMATAAWVGGLLGGVLWLVWMVAALRSWRQTPRGELQWDAQGPSPGLRAVPGVWRWRSAGLTEATALLQVQLVLDGQVCMLLRLRSAWSVPHWIWVEQSSAPGRWLDMRRALSATRA
jgi:hypothetical protein